MGFNIGSFLGGLAPIIGGLFGGPVGAAIGGVVGGALSGASASPPGRVTTPPPPPPPVATAMTSVVPVFTRQQSARTQFAPTFSAQPIAFGPGVVTAGRAVARVGSASSLVGDIFDIFGGDDKKMSAISEILAQARQTFGRGVTKNKIIDAAKNCGIELAAQTFGLSVTQICTVVVQGKTRRRRGISASDVRRTRRTIRFVNSLRKDLKKVSAR